MPTVQPEKGPKFVSLKEERKETAVEAPKRDYYPTLYISDKSIGIGNDDINETLRAEIKIKPKRITRSEENGVKRVSYDIEVQAIRIL